ncbi:cysteine--tRNA ligase-like [Oppia nitens]|uniref:cysteine--tRNA ligase-like n=1 Tax=Oppia nitens TaxID=1686743 RepID=UPI0023DC95CD|nr:cysteine--tRNA ligase-like [Oppia nitens]
MLLRHHLKRYIICKNIIQCKSMRRLSQLSVETIDELVTRKQILLQNSFSKSKKMLDLSTRSDGLSDPWMTMYCCGPTVYEDCHLGHALTYIRCDLLRRVLRQYYNCEVLLAMNMTDIDDKIIAKANHLNCDFRKVTNQYTNSFIEDMKSLNVMPANCYLRVTDHMNTIINYINTIRDKGFAYISDQTNDINFDFEHFIKSYNINNYLGGDDMKITDKSVGKKSPKDFALWKSAKNGEPNWRLVTTDGITIPGRPGWHIECSALVHKVFGTQLDIHFGGHDLRFPHHHCESCCSHAFLELDDSKPLYSWGNIWLHSGHLNLKSEKMSKSLGNVILIKDFLKKYSPNILRLFCIKLHYRSDFQYEEHLIAEMQNIDKKLLDFKENLNLEICKLCSNNISLNLIKNQRQALFSEAIDETERSILRGISDDLDLEMGLKAVLLLAKQFNSTADYSLLDLIRVKALYDKWLDGMGLTFISSIEDTTAREALILNALTKFRSDVRQIALKSLKNIDKTTNNTDVNNISNELHQNTKDLLTLCDTLRLELDGFGIKFKDLPVSTILK